MIEYVNCSILAGIFWRMGGFQAALNVLTVQVAILRKRVAKLEKERPHEKLA